MKMRYFYIFLLIIIAPALTMQAQMLTLYDFDTSEFPTIKAKLWATDRDGEFLRQLQPADFRVTENGEQVEVSRVVCPPIVQLTEPYSIAMSIDISGSMQKRCVLKSRSNSGS